MKPDIHPEYVLATVHCACGNVFKTRSTQSDIHTDICSVCHPYFTGRQKLVDTAGRVERFRQKWAKTEEAQAERAAAAAAAESPPAGEEAEEPAEA